MRSKEGASAFVLSANAPLPEIHAKPSAAQYRRQKDCIKRLNVNQRGCGLEVRNELYTKNLQTVPLLDGK